MFQKIDDQLMKFWNSQILTMADGCGWGHIRSYLNKKQC